MLQVSKFIPETDHGGLKYLMTCDLLRGKLARYAIHLQQFDFEIHYEKGVNNVNADSVSRMAMKEQDEADGISEPVEDIFLICFMAHLDEAAPAQDPTSPSHLGVPPPSWTHLGPPPTMHPALPLKYPQPKGNHIALKK